MSSSPQIHLPQIPQNLDHNLKDYLSALSKVIIQKQIDDYSTIEELKKRLTELEK